MSYYWAERGKCSNCVNFEYKGENEKGYCSYYKEYYHNDDSCSHQEDKED